MGCLTVKTLCKGIAILFFVSLQGLNASAALLVTTSSPLTQTSSQTPVTTPPASTSSSATETQTSAHSTLLVTTSSSLTQTSSQTPVTTPPASTSSSATETQTSAHSKPDVIKNLKVTNITTSSVFLRWDKPIENITFFKITWTSDDTVVHNENTTSSTFFNDITGLTAGVNYTFCVTAVIKENKRESERFCISTYTEPDVIRSLTVSNVSTSSVFLTWDEPVGIRSYFKLNWTGDKTIGNASKITNTSYNITDLTAGVSYTFSITAVAADNSTEGKAICISQYTKPDVIRNLAVSEVTTSSVFLKWEEPIGNRFFFILQWTDDETNRNDTKTSNTSHNITDLIPGVNYTFCITAVAADEGETKGETFCISQYTKPDVIRSLTVSNVSTSSVFLTWKEPIGKRSFFKVNWTDNKTNRNAMETSITSHHITNLTAGVNYMFCVTAVTADNFGESELFCISKYTVPNMIRNLTVTNITTSSVFLTWQEPAGYRSFFKLLGTGDKTIGNASEITNYNITDLTAGVSYTFSITAVAADNSTEGDAICISQYTKPNMISNLKASEVTTSSVFLTWDEPSGKRAFFKLQQTEEKRMYTITSNTSHHITDLTAGVNYTFCITAVAADNSTEGDTFCISQYTKYDAVPPIGVIVGSVVAVICFLFIITLILLFYSRRQTKKQCPDIPVHNIREKINLALRIEDYEEYFKRKHADSNCGFAEEYEELKSVGKAQSKDAAEAIENKAKNRYTNVLPYDASRVKLSMCGNPFDDYINANYVPGYNSRKEFIAAQGPLPVTVNEFWRMIWEKNVYTIVMLTKCNELGRVKCEMYWPSGTNHYHNISVATTSDITLDSWTIRDFKIKNVKTAETRYVRQFHFTAWPDHGVPQTTEVLIDFRHLVREHMDQYSRHSPTVVHCSAGVGRTGTFIAIDHLIFQIERESMVDVYGIVNDMRMHRPLMVQTEEQYVYLHQCAYDIIRSRTGTNVDLIYQNTEALHSIYQNVKYIKS